MGDVGRTVEKLDRIDGSGNPNPSIGQFRKCGLDE
jgi:hypothetical protein